MNCDWLEEDQSLFPDKQLTVESNKKKYECIIKHIDQCIPNRVKPSSIIERIIECDERVMEKLEESLVIKEIEEEEDYFLPQLQEAAPPVPLLPLYMQCTDLQT
jgi:hypothetical protein